MKNDKITEEEIITPNKEKFISRSLGKVKYVIPLNVHSVPGEVNKYKRFDGELNIEILSAPVRGLNSIKVQPYLERLKAKFKTIKQDSAWTVISHGKDVQYLLVKGVMFGIPGDRFEIVRAFQSNDSTRIMRIGGLEEGMVESEINTILTNFY